MAVADATGIPPSQQSAVTQELSSAETADYSNATELNTNRFKLWENNGAYKDMYKMEADRQDRIHNQAMQNFNLQAALRGQDQNFALGDKKLDINATTVNAEAGATNAMTGVIGSLQAKLEATDDPREIAKLVNSITAISGSQAQQGAMASTMTKQGHGQTTNTTSGMMGQTTNTLDNQLETQADMHAISANTQLGLATTKSNTDLGLGGLQADVAIHGSDNQTNVANNSIENVQGVMAEGNFNMNTGIGKGTAGYTSGFNSTYNGNYNGNYSGNYSGFGYNPFMYSGGGGGSSGGAGSSLSSQLDSLGSGSISNQTS